MKPYLVAVFVFCYLVTSSGISNAESATSNPEDTSTSPASAPNPDVTISANPTTETTPDSTNSGQTPPKQKKKKRKKVKIKARVHSRWIMEHHPDTSGDEQVTNEFAIRRARFKLYWEPETWLLAVIQVGGFHKTKISRRLLRDAYIHLSPIRFLEFRAGYFKKPFSRLALRSSGKLRVVERGLGNELILDDLLYGGRDLGVQISGRLVPSIELDYELGFFNGTGYTDSGDDYSSARERDDQKDIVARLKMNPTSWFAFGVNGSFKFSTVAKPSTIEVEVPDTSTEDPTDTTTVETTVYNNDDQMTWAAGADAVMKISNLRLHVEGILAQNHVLNTDFTNRRELKDNEFPLIFSFVSILSYKHKFDTDFRFAVEPIFMFELLEPDTVINKDETLVFSPGFNSYFGKYFRLMIHGEFRRPLRNAKELFSKKEMLYVQLCVDI